MIEPVVKSIEVAAPPDEVYALLADPHRHHEFDASGTVKGCADAVLPLRVGSTFVMEMRLNGLSYRSVNEIVVLDAPTRIAWRTSPRSRLIGLLFPGGQTWSFDLAAHGDGTRVTQTWDPSTLRGHSVGVRMMRFREANSEGMDGTLQRLRERFATAAG